MASLDQKTLLVVVVSITFLMGILMFHFKRNNPSISGPSFWSNGSFLIAFGTVMYLIYPQTESYLVLVVSSTITILGITFYVAGFQLFNGKKISYWILLGIPLAELIQATLFYSIVPVPYLRMAGYSLMNALIGIVMIREFMRPVAKIYRVAYYSGILVFIIYSLTSLVRMVFALYYQPKVSLDLGNANVILFFFHSITQTLLLFVFVLLIGIRLTEELNKKIADQQKFFSIIAHDLNGPVGSIAQILGYVNETEDFPEKEKTVLLNELEKMSQSTYHLLQNLLFWSRKQLDGLSPVIQKFDLNKVIEDNLVLLRHLSRTKKITIDYTPAETLYCMGDERMIDTVIRNLVSNSIKFTHTEGKITIDCQKEESMIRIRIVDNGIGMNEKTRKNLFSFKETTSKSGTGGEGGTGFGLMLCKDFVEENKGSISIHSEENKGTEIVLTFMAG